MLRFSFAPLGLVEVVSAANSSSLIGHVVFFTLVLGVQFSTILHLLQIIEQKAPALSARLLGDGEP